MHCTLTLNVFILKKTSGERLNSHHVILRIICYAERNHNICVSGKPL